MYVPFVSFMLARDEIRTLPAESRAVISIAADIYIGGLMSQECPTRYVYRVGHSEAYLHYDVDSIYRMKVFQKR